MIVPRCRALRQCSIDGRPRANALRRRSRLLRALTSPLVPHSYLTPSHPRSQNGVVVAELDQILLNSNHICMMVPGSEPGAAP